MNVDWKGNRKCSLDHWKIICQGQNLYDLSDLCNLFGYPFVRILPLY